MNKRIAGLSLIAASGFTVLSAAPALADVPAISYPGPFENCDAAAAAGFYNIPSNHPSYGPNLDRDMDGIGCDDPTKPMIQWPPVEPTPPTVPPTPQVGQVPAGGAGTGITEDPQQAGAGVLALGGGLVLAAAAGGTYAIRRRRALQG